ncbi:MAG: RidA family protein [Nannocystaceae bacterium]
MPRVIHPPNWPRPQGYSNGMAARGEFLAVAGQVAWDQHKEIVSTQFTLQFRRALANVLAIVNAAGGEARHLISLTIYVTDKTEYENNLPAIGAAYRELMGKHFPAMALVEVAGLLEKGAKIEISALAVIEGADS